MKLFQYWDTGEPPDDVAGWIEGFRAMNPEMNHRLYDRDSAAWFIGKHLGERQRRAFDACAVPAMQADYFRLCALAAKGGLWIDADTEPLRPLSGFFERAPHSLMLEWEGYFGTMVMLFRAPGDAFVGVFLELATANIEERRFSSPLLATGPVLADALRGVLDPGWAAAVLAKGDDPLVVTRRGLVEHVRPRVTASDGLLQAYRAMTIVSLLDARDHLAFKDPPYKSTDRHWTNWKTSIYRDGAGAATKEPA